MGFQPSPSPSPTPPLQSLSFVAPPSTSHWSGGQNPCLSICPHPVGAVAPTFATEVPLLGSHQLWFWRLGCTSNFLRHFAAQIFVPTLVAVCGGALRHGTPSYLWLWILPSREWDSCVSFPLRSASLDFLLPPKPFPLPITTAAIQVPGVQRLSLQ